MQVNSVSMANSNPAFKGPREELEKFAYMDDKDTQKLALAKASKDVNDKKARRISNALYLAAPISAGLYTASLFPSKMLTKVGKTNISRAVKLLEGTRGALGCAALFLGIDAVFAAKKKVENSNPSIKEFSQNHPLVSFFGTVAATLGAFYGLKRGAGFLSKSIGSKNIPVKNIKSFLKFSEKLQNSKILNKASKYMDNVPKFAKSMAKSTLSWGPVLFILGRLVHDQNHARRKVMAFQDNYNQIKSEQEVIKTALAVQDELASTIED